MEGIFYLELQSIPANSLISSKFVDFYAMNFSILLFCFLRCPSSSETTFRAFWDVGRVMGSFRADCWRLSGLGIRAPGGFLKRFWG